MSRLTLCQQCQSDYQAESEGVLVNPGFHGRHVHEVKFPHSIEGMEAAFRRVLEMEKDNLDLLKSVTHL